MAQTMFRKGIGGAPSTTTAAADNFGNAAAPIALGAGNSIGVVVAAGITRDQAAQLLEEIRSDILDGRLTASFPT
jgi:hypothetical protein